MRTPLIWTALLAAALTPSAAEAHFILDTPAAMTAQDASGNPQKNAPCGPAGAGEPTGMVTAYQSGSTITITIDETIFHPGHYRVALAVNDPSELPDAPPITATPQDDCAETVIQDPPVFPVLADGMLPHDAPFNGPQTFEVTLPDDVTCDNCTLQVIQYMSNHAAPCFYYHCAALEIQTEPVMTTSASSSSSTSSGSGGAGSGTGGDDTTSGAGASSGSSNNNPSLNDDGGGCAMVEPGASPSSNGWAMLGLGLGLTLALRRRRDA